MGAELKWEFWANSELVCQIYQMTSASELCAMITAPQANYELVQEYYGKYIYTHIVLFSCWTLRFNKMTYYANLEDDVCVVRHSPPKNLYKMLQPEASSEQKSAIP